MTKPGETDNFTASDFIRIIRQYLQKAGNKISHVVINTKFPEDVQTLAWYLRHSSKPFKDDLEGMRDLGVKVVRGGFTQRGELLRHDPAKLVRALTKLL